MTKMLDKTDIYTILGRVKTQVDLTDAERQIKGKTVLVTGGGGTIGGELCRRIADFEPKKLIIADICENGAFETQNAIRRRGFADSIIEIFSVADRQMTEKIFAAYKPDIVYHAAAHKHVSLMEKCRAEAIKNNIFGTKNVIDMSDKYNAERFVFISTDKAVDPTSVMGTTKRVGELMIKRRGRDSHTKFSAVRFGNVFASSGSAVEVFVGQILSGGPVTVTRPDCRRYFMSISEAAELVLSAGAVSDGGDVFVLDMGERVKIDDIARKVIEAFGYVPNEDIMIEYIGMKDGEKLTEELVSSDETLVKTSCDKIYAIKEKEGRTGDLWEKLGNLKSELNKGDEDAMMRALKELVPEYKFCPTGL